MKHLLITIAMLMALNAFAERDFPLLCDSYDVESMARDEAEQKFGDCKIFKNEGVRKFGHPTGKFQEGHKVILKCEKKDFVAMKVIFNVDARKKSCEVAKIEEGLLSGQYCGLSEEFNDEVWKEINSRHIALYRLNDDQIDDLPTIVKQQVIITAKETNPEIKSTKEAIAYLKEGSEGDEVHYNVYRVKGKIYNEVKTYGGGNPTSTIFRDGELRVHAHNGDDSIMCAK
jgi:hypothetical protein